MLQQGISPLVLSSKSQKKGFALIQRQILLTCRGNPFSARPAARYKQNNFHIFAPRGYSHPANIQLCSGKHRCLPKQADARGFSNCGYNLMTPLLRISPALGFCVIILRRFGLTKLAYFNRKVSPLM